MRRPIGVFDSGLGGLTAVRELVRLLPGEDIIYLGDTGRVPYGPRSDEAIIKYTAQARDFLLSKNTKHIIIACGTVSSVVLEKAGLYGGEGMTGVVAPSAKRAAELTKNGRVGLIGTQATVRARAYENALHRLAPGAQVFSAACPLLVPLVEAGRIHRGDAVTETVVAEYLAPLREEGVDTLILGCTHYPLLREIIQNFMGGGVALVDSGAAAAAAAAALCGAKPAPAPGKIEYFVTDSADGFETVAELFLQMPVHGAVTKIDLEGSFF